MTAAIVFDRKCRHVIVVANAKVEMSLKGKPAMEATWKFVDVYHVGDPNLRIDDGSIFAGGTQNFFAEPLLPPI